MSVTQAAFRAALLDPAAAVPTGLTDPVGRPAGKRFDVYRNNVVASLAAALETAFPALRTLLGADRFRGLAIAYSRAHPPRSPLMMHVGADLPAFLEAAAPLQRMAYLADVARLEIALRESYHAADADPIDPAALQAIPPEALDGVRLSLAPAVRLVASRYPVVALHRHALEDAPWPAPDGETALVTRPGYDPVVTPLSPASGAFVAALAAGEPLGRAAEAGAGADQSFDPSFAIGALLQGRAISALDKDPAP